MNLKDKIKFISSYQIIGGIIGLLTIILKFCFEEFSFGLNTTIFLTLFGLLYTFSIFCGFKLLRSDLQLGIKFSQINQCIQFINFSILGFSYCFISGFNLSIGVDFTNKFLLKIWGDLSKCEFYIKQNENFIIGINIVAIGIFITLSKIKKQLSIKILLEERVINRLSDIN